MHIEKNKSLKPFNTFGIEANARLFASINTVSQLKEVIHEYQKEKLFILGGGSNLLLRNNIDALVLHINLKGVSILEELEHHVIVEAQAGENWHQFVSHCIENNWGGLENLSLIPGNVGTAPIQNIGAYGVELKDSFVNCKALDIESGKLTTFNSKACRFGYRDSVFKNALKNKYIITSVCFRLSKVPHTLHTEYGAIQEVLREHAIENPTIKDVAQAVISIRESKLPDPKRLGNSGSFFKNPVINETAYQRLIQQFPEAPSYRISETEVKIPAGWLIEKMGFKGYRDGDAGVHHKQALVLVNHGNATGNQIWELAKTIQEKVYQQFNITIDPEVNVI